MTLGFGSSIGVHRDRAPEKLQRKQFGHYMPYEKAQFALNKLVAKFDGVLSENDADMVFLSCAKKDDDKVFGALRKLGFHNLVVDFNEHSVNKNSLKDVINNKGLKVHIRKNKLGVYVKAAAQGIF